MLKAEIGDFWTIIILAVLMFAGVFEKMLKAKRQQQAPPPPPQPYDDFEDVEEQTAQRQPPSTTLEEMMRRMMQTVEMPEQAAEKAVVQPQDIKKREQSGRIAYTPVSVVPVEEIIETADAREFHFDFRQAVIASEILNRKY